MEKCPFCITEIPEGAGVCRGCGASKQIRGNMLLMVLFLGAFWVFWGPIVSFLAIKNVGSGDDMAMMMLIIGALVTLAGGWLMWWLIRSMFTPVWTR